MKKQIMLLTAIVLVAMVPFFNATSGVSKYAAKFSWERLVHDFGQIKKDAPVTANFEFVNQGTEPLVVSSVKGSCGCTVAAYTKEAIMPGEKGKVTATYNAAKVGAFNKTVTVTANTQSGPIVLSIKGEVLN